MVPVDVVYILCRYRTIPSYDLTVLNFYDWPYVLLRLFTGMTLYSAFPAVGGYSGHIRSSRVFVTVRLIFLLVLPIRDCNTPARIATWMGAVAGCLNTLLFLFRVNGVFWNHKPAKAFFTTLWVITSIGIFAVPFSLTAGLVHPGDMCIIQSMSKFAIIPSLMVAIFDLTVYVSISYQTINFQMAHSKIEMCKAFFTGTHTGPVTEALLRTGQLYFL